MAGKIEMVRKHVPNIMMLYCMPRYQIACLLLSADTRQKLNIRLRINKQIRG